jgi:hypothetical protein
MVFIPLNFIFNTKQLFRIFPEALCALTYLFKDHTWSSIREIEVVHRFTEKVARRNGFTRILVASERVRKAINRNKKLAEF